MDKKNKIIIPLLFILVLFIYLLTLSPAVNFEDSGEFITSAHTLSVAHPPGYPLYLLLGKLFSFLPLGTPEFKINLMSAFFAALSAVVLYILLFRILGLMKERQRHFISGFIILFYFLSSTLWDISLVAEVYTLNLFLAGLLLLIIEKIYFENRSEPGMPEPYRSKAKYHYLFFYLLGVSICNHHTILFIGLIYLVFFFKSKTARTLKKNNYYKFFILFILGLSIYAYLPIRAGTNPIINWGNPSNIKNFLAVLFRKQYGDVGSELIPLGTFFKHILTVNPVYELFKSTNTKIDINHIPSVIILGAALYFLYSGLKSIKKKNIRLFFVLLFILYSFFIVFLANAPEDKLFTLKVFFIPAWFALYFILFYGIFKTMKNYSFYAFPILFLMLFLINFRFQNRKNYLYTNDYALNILRSLPHKSILFTLKDNETFPTWNMKYVQQKRPDVIAINLVLLSEQWYLDHVTAFYPGLKIDLAHLKGKFQKKHIRQKFFRSIINSNPDRDIYFTSKHTTSEYKKFVDIEIDIHSSGLLYKLNYIPTSSLLFHEFNNLKNDFAVFVNLFNKKNIENFKSRIGFLDTQTRYVLQTVAFSFLEYANGLFQYGLADDSRYFYQYSIYINNIIGAGINNIYAYANIGNIFLQNGDKDNAVYFYKKGIELQPNSDLAKGMVTKIKKLTQLEPGQIEKEIRPTTKRTKKDEKIAGLSVLAENFYQKNDYKSAIKFYEKLLKVEPDNPITFSNMGDCHFNMGKYGEAVQYYQKAIELKKDYVTAYYNLGGCYVMLNKKMMAKKTWETGLKYSPGNQRLLNALKQYFK